MDLVEARLRALVRELCHTPLLIGSFVAVDDAQIATFERMHGELSNLRKTIATPDELLTALANQIKMLDMANRYLRSQLDQRQPPR